MKKYLLFIIAGLFSLNNIKSQTIAAARAAALGTTVTVRGVVTNGGEFGSQRFMQDATAGILAFGTGLIAVIPGDSIVVVGPTALYNNLLEIFPINTFSVISSFNTLPVPAVISPTTLGEPIESKLVRINTCTTSATGNFAGSTGYTLTSASQSFQIFIDPTNSNLIGTPIPSTPFDIIGIASQYCISPTIGCTVGYQLKPRKLSDIILLPTGINEKEKVSSLSIYPNPSNDIIYLKADLPIKSITINDMQGRLVYSEKENTNSVDIKGLSVGIYNITILTDNKVYHSKFSVQ